MDRETVLAHNFEQSAHADDLPAVSITPSQALRAKHQHLQSIATLANQFGAKIVDVSENSVIVELTAKTARVEAFLSLVKPFGILEAARTGQLSFVYAGCHHNLNFNGIGLMAMPRTPITSSGGEDEFVADAAVAVDASLLPPG